MAVRSLQLKTKLLLGFAFLAAVVTGVAGQGLLAAGRANDRFSDYLAGIAQRERLATDVQAAATQRAIAARNVVLVDVAERDAELRVVLQAQDEVQGALERLDGAVQASDSHAKERQLLGNLGKVETEYSALVLVIGKLVGENQRDAAVAKMNRECRPLLRQLLALTGELVEHYHHQAAQEQAAAARSSSTDRTLMAGVSALAVAIAIALGGWLANAVTLPLRRAVGYAQAVAAGNLGSNIQVNTQDETGALLQSLKDMTVNLLEMVMRVRESADGIAVASAEIAAGNQDLSNRTEQQASALQETASSMQEMTAMVRQNVASSEQASDAASMAYEVASRGGHAVERVVATMNDIAGASQQIAEITGVIDGIAFQTNILALNAAVEAARAGEQGRGFAVVAGEVRSLAQRSAEAAKQIKTLIGNSTEKVAAGSQLVNEAGTTMQEIVAQVQRMTTFITEIKTATAAQSGGIAQVNEAVAAIDQGTQRNAALVEQSAAAAESLKQQAAGLLSAISVFKTKQHPALV